MKKREIDILEYILRCKELPSQIKIAKEFNLSRERIRQIMAILEKNNYIKRFPNGKYKKLLRPTKKLIIIKK